MPNKLIALRLGISEKTVKTHLTSVFRTIGVTDRVQAVLWAERQGLRGELRARDRPAARMGPMSRCRAAACPHTGAMQLLRIGLVVALAAIATLVAVDSAGRRR